MSRSAFIAFRTWHAIYHPRPFHTLDWPHEHIVIPATTIVHLASLSLAGIPLQVHYHYTKSLVTEHNDSTHRIEV